MAPDLESRCLVEGKESELFEVAVNLVKNAVEACREGGEIRVKVLSEGDLVILQVRDNGAGIHEADLGKVFQPFWTTKGFQGTGMGLSSSYGIVTRHGGEISVESVEGKGGHILREASESPKPEDPSCADCFKRVRCEFANPSH